jgi:5-methylcytosine-specific restriction endonuclease McrA
MAWLPIHQTLPSHPKTLALQDILDIDPASTVGHLVCLWLWSLDHTDHDGLLASSRPRVIASAAQWYGDRDKFFEALLEVGFIDQEDEGIMLHGWEDYAGRLLERRESDASRKTDMRKAYHSGVIEAVRLRDGDSCRYCGIQVNWAVRHGPTGGTYDHLDPTLEATTDNLVVACRGCNSQKGREDTHPGGMVLTHVNGASNAHLTRIKHSVSPHLPTVQYTTEHNRDTREPENQEVPAAIAAQAPPSGHSVGEYKKGITQFSRMGQRVKFLVDMVRFELPEEPRRSDDGDLASQLLKSAGDPELAVANLWKALDPVIEGSRFRYAIGITTSENGKQTAEGQRLIVGLPELCDCSHYQRQHQKIHPDGPCSVAGCGCQAWQAQEVNDEA